MYVQPRVFAARNIPLSPPPPPSPRCLYKTEHVGNDSAATPVPPLSIADMSYTPESEVDVSISSASTADAWEGDMLVLLAFQQEDKEAFASIAGDLGSSSDGKLGGIAQDIIDAQEFKVMFLVAVSSTSPESHCIGV